MKKRILEKSEHPNTIAYSKKESMTRLSIFAVFSLDSEEDLQTIFLQCGVREAEYVEKTLGNCFDGILCWLLLFLIFQVLSLHLKIVFKRFFLCLNFFRAKQREMTSIQVVLEMLSFNYLTLVSLDLAVGLVLFWDKSVLN